ncbi:MAG: hypothetical protein ACE3JP_04895 [Ectobacillus sp.]
MYIYKQLGLLIMMAVWLAGCVSGTADIQVHKNGSADAVIRFGIAQQAKRYLGSVNPFGHMESILKSNGFKVKQFDYSKSFGFEASQHYRSIRSLQKEKAVAASGNNKEERNDLGSFSTEMDKQWFSTTYRVKSTIDFSSLYEDFLASFGRYLQASDNMRGFVAEELKKNISLKLRVTLPVRAESSNATRLENGGKTVEWKLHPTKENKLIMTVKVPNIKNIVIASGIFVFLLLVFIFIWIKKRRKKKSQSEQ